MTAGMRFDCAEVDDLAGLFVLDALSADEAAAVNEHLSTCPQPHESLVAMAGAASAVAASVEPVAPPAELRGRVLSAVAATPQVPEQITVVSRAGVTVAPAIAGRSPAVPEPVSLAAARDRRGPSRLAWIGLAAAAAIVIAALGAWNVTLQQQVSDTQGRVALIGQAISAATAPGSTVAILTSTEPGGTATGMAIFPSSGPGYIMVEGLPDIGSDQTYQAWYLAGGQPTSAGLMEVGPNGLAIVGGLEPVTGTDTVALTVEPAGGVEQPTGSPVVAGTLPAVIASVPAI